MTSRLRSGVGSALRRERSRSGRVSARFRTVALAGSITASIALAPAIAGAEPVSKPASRAPDSGDVRELMRTGVAEYKKGNLSAARDAFLKAWAIQPHFAIAASLAEVEKALGEYRSTAEHLDYYLSNLPDELSDKRPAAEQQLAECRKHLAGLRITTDPPGATVSLDGNPPPPPLRGEVLVDPGRHVLVAERAGVQSKPLELDLAAGESREVELDVRPPVPPVPPPPAPVVRDTVPPARAPTAHAPPYVWITGGALTLVAVGVGVGFTLAASSAQNDADAASQKLDQSSGAGQNTQCSNPNTAPPACGDLSDALDRRDQSRNIALGAFIGAGVLAAGTVAAYFLWPKKAGSEHAAVRMAPWIAKAGGASLAVDF